MPSVIRRLASNIARNERGSAAVEFAVIVPIMLTLFFGVVEFSSGIAVDRKVTLVARTMSDLTSQSSCVTQTDLDGFTITGKSIMTPYSTTPLNTTITSIYIDNNLDAKAQWSKGSAARGVGSAVPVPTALKIANTYLIFSEVSYLYTPVGIGYVMKANVNLKDQTYTRPRQTASVRFSTTTCT